MYTLVKIIDLLFDIFLIIIIAQVAISWLIAFGVMNLNNPQARKLVETLKKITDPIYEPLRKIIPPLGGIDITPIIVIFGLSVLKDIIIGLLL